MKILQLSIFSFYYNATLFISFYGFRSIDNYIMAIVRGIALFVIQWWKVGKVDFISSLRYLRLALWSFKVFF